MEFTRFEFSRHFNLLGFIATGFKTAARLPTQRWLPRGLPQRS